MDQEDSDFTEDMKEVKRSKIWAVITLSLNAFNSSGKQQQSTHTQGRITTSNPKVLPHKATHPAPGSSGPAADPRGLKRLQEVLCCCVWLGLCELLKRQLQGSAGCRIAGGKEKWISVKL